MTSRHPFDFDVVHPSWQDCIKNALKRMDPSYLNDLYTSTKWLPGHDKIFNAFSLPVDKINYILFGESPYPREKSANGYAFWDAAVTDLWSDTGLSKNVNRATSLRNIIKMLLLTEGVLDAKHTRQTDIAQIAKEPFICTNHELFGNFLRQGFLLLNATLVLQDHKVAKDASAWHPFIKYVLEFLNHERPDIHLILFGKIAQLIDKQIQIPPGDKLYAEHPYNLSFITNPKVL